MGRRYQIWPHGIVLSMTLCNYLERRGKIPSSMIKAAIEPHWPEANNVSKHDVINIRAKLIKLLPTFQKTNNGDYEEFKKVANSNDMLSGTENTPSLDDDEVYQLAQSLWLEVSNTTMMGKRKSFLSSNIWNSLSLGRRDLPTG